MPGFAKANGLDHNPTIGGHVAITVPDLDAALAWYERMLGFSLEERLEMGKELAAEYPNVEVIAFEGLLRDFVVAHGGKVVVRGLRAVSDFAIKRVTGIGAVPLTSNVTAEVTITPLAEMR